MKNLMHNNKVKRIIIKPIFCVNAIDGKNLDRLIRIKTVGPTDFFPSNLLKINAQ
jgi:hypothetical protein